MQSYKHQPRQFTKHHAKPLAPQGEWLKERVLAGHFEIVIIFMGVKAKERAQSFLPELPYTLYLPYKESPSAYIWPVHGCEVNLIDTSPSSDAWIKHVVTCLFQHGAKIISYNHSNYFKTFRRS